MAPWHSAEWILGIISAKLALSHKNMHCLSIWKKNHAKWSKLICTIINLYSYIKWSLYKAVLYSDIYRIKISLSFWWFMMWWRKIHSMVNFLRCQMHHQRHCKTSPAPMETLGQWSSNCYEKNLRLGFYSRNKHVYLYKNVHYE